MTIGDPVSAERNLRAGYETFHDMGDRYYLGAITVMLAEALYTRAGSLRPRK